MLDLPIDDRRTFAARQDGLQKERPGLSSAPILFKCACELSRPYARKVDMIRKRAQSNTESGGGYLSHAGGFGPVAKTLQVVASQRALVEQRQ